MINRIYHWLILTIFLVVPCLADQSVQTNKPTLSSGASDRINDVRKKLSSELLKAGTPMENPTLIRQMRDKLAKAGDETERKRIIDELQSKDPVAQYHAIQSAKIVGGKDMIAVLAQLLSDKGGYKTLGSTEKGAQGDLVFEPPRFLAAKALSKLVPNPPVPQIGENKKIYTDADIERWREWWEKNKDTYK